MTGMAKKVVLVLIIGTADTKADPPPSKHLCALPKAGFATIFLNVIIAFVCCAFGARTGWHPDQTVIGGSPVARFDGKGW